MNQYLEKLVRNKAEILLGLFSVSLLPAIYIAEKSLGEMLCQYSQQLAIRLIGMLLIFLVVALAYSVHFYKIAKSVPNIDDYTYVKDPGYFVKNKTSQHFCNPCLVDKHIASPLSVHHIDGLKCRLCGEIYIDPKSEHAAFAEYCEKKNLIQ